MNKTLVSIIMPTYNSEKFLSESINSILDQSFKNWELLITDDCSTDDTIKIVKKYIENDSRIRLFVLEKNSGAGVARNNSIKEAQGRFIAFCDSDDLWQTDKLKKQVEFLNENNIAFTYSSYDKINEKGEKVGSYQPPVKISYSDLLKTCHIGCLTAIYDASKIGKFYMPTIRKRQDYGLWLKIFKEIRGAEGQQEVLAFYRIRKNSISRNKLKAAGSHYKVLRTVGEIPRLKAMYYFCYYMVVGFVKYLK